MAEVKVLEGQSLFDLSIQTAGGIEAAFSLANANEISITDTLMPAADILMSDMHNKDIAGYYAVKSLKPATDLGGDDMPGGIDYMGIEIDFIIS